MPDLHRAGWRPVRGSKVAHLMVYARQIASWASGDLRRGADFEGVTACGQTKVLDPGAIPDHDCGRCTTIAERWAKGSAA